MAMQENKLSSLFRWTYSRVFKISFTVLLESIFFPTYSFSMVFIQYLYSHYLLHHSIWSLPCISLMLLEGRKKQTTYLQLAQMGKNDLPGVMQDCGGGGNKTQFLPFQIFILCTNIKMHLFYYREWFLPRLLWLYRWSLWYLSAERRTRNTAQGTGFSLSITITLQVHGEATGASICAI